MKKFWKSKKLWIILILLGIGVLVYYLSSKEIIVLNEEEKKEKETEEKYKGDNNEPYSQIQPLSEGSWQKKDFKIRVLDEDLESGIKEGSCWYKVYSYGPDGEEISSGWRDRKCNDIQAISVGPEGECQFEGRDSCYIYVTSQDNAGNWYSPSEEELSIKSYNIDWTSPFVSKIIIEKEDYKAKIETTDIFKIVECLLYIDGENQGTMNFLDSRCYNNCSLEKDFIISDAGTHNIYAYCRDISGNWGKGEATQIIVNTPPAIDHCKSAPTSGNKDTEIQFAVEVEDINNDNLSFFWNFGDETFSQEKSPTHTYSESGTYHPTITVSDGKGGEDNCSTAWITIAE